MAAKAPEKQPFTWQGKDRKGQKVKGESLAATEALVRAELRRQGITPLSIRRKSKPLLSSQKAITPKDISVFSRQLATMMSAGIPLVQAFEIVGRGHENPSMQDLILTVKGDVESGAPLADSLAKHPDYFDDLFVNLVRAGEQSGALETLLDKIAVYKEKTEAIKGKVKSALFYPVAVLIAAVIVSAILLIFVVPQFQELFQGFGADLPAFTLFVIGLSESFQKNWWIIFGSIGIVYAAFTQAQKRSKAFRELLDKIALNAPIFGEIVLKSSIARFARTLSTMFAAGVPLVEALESVSGAAGNAVFTNAILKMRDDAATGQQLQASMRQTNLFPNMVVQMVAIGEESGALDTMLGKVADFYEEEVDNLVDALSSLMEPIIMAFLGVLVGGLVIAMYLPIFKMGESV